jgi:hypothetical protein
MSPSFDLDLGGGPRKPGDTIAGTVVVREGGRSRSLEVLLEFVEETADYLEVASSVSTGHLHKGKLEPGMSFAFELAVPPDALPEVRSRHGQLYWRLDVKSDEIGRDSHERRRIVVATS